MTIATGSQALASDMLHSLNADGYISFAASSTLTIASGAITASKNWYVVDTESAASTDDLDTITVGTNVDDGHLLILHPANDAHTVVVKHGTGNILLIDSADISLDDKQDICLLIYDANLTKWCGFSGTLGNRTVGTAQLALNSVDDTIAGNRVPQFYRRQGGSATDWNAVGTTSRTPTSVRQQAGAIAVTGLAASHTGSITVTFPVAFSAIPLIFVCVTGTNANDERYAICSVANPTATNFLLVVTKTDGSGGGGSDNFQGASLNVQWFAVGAE